jgi:hypothetical protein
VADFLQRIERVPPPCSGQNQTFVNSAEKTQRSVGIHFLNRARIIIAADPDHDRMRSKGKMIELRTNHTKGSSIFLCSRLSVQFLHHTLFGIDRRDDHLFQHRPEMIAFEGPEGQIRFDEKQNCCITIGFARADDPGLLETQTIAGGTTD